VYRFLLTPRWLGLAALIGVAATVMVLLGNWQLHRYQERSAVNERIDSAAQEAPVPLPAKPPAAWSRVTATGRYDTTNEILVRGRTVDGQVGFEVVTPLVLADGSALLVDRGWVPPAPGGAVAVPKVPAPPTGEVTVSGRIHETESRPNAVTRREGRIEVRRIGIARLAEELPYPLYGAYLLDEKPGTGLTAISIQHENSWQNAGYVVQWWLFAALAVAGFGWLAYREAHPHEQTDRALV
jgi:cytochrome oxidase assembly protein ShyY1